MKAVRYSLEEAFVSLRRAGRSTLMSVGTVAVAFVTLGGFFLGAANLQQIIAQWASAAEMSVFLRDDIDAASRAVLTAALQSNRAVSNVEFVSKEQALARFTTDFPELSDLAGATSDNPFPASFEVRLRTDPELSAAADDLAAQVRTLTGVVDVRYDREWLNRVIAIVNGIRLAGLAVAGVLILGAAFTVAAVVRLSLFARREEIEIMRLVGSPFAFIRGPSVAEGAIIGGVGAIVALVLLLSIYQAFKLQLTELTAAIAERGEWRFLGFTEAVVMVAAAVALGALTGVMVARAIR